jgi:hypothetical protein
MIMAVNWEFSQITLLPTGASKARRYASIHCQRLKAMSGFNVALSLARRPSLGGLFQQRLGLLQVGGVKALGEPAVDRRQQLARFGALALLLPQAAQADGGPQLQRLGLPVARHGEDLLETDFCRIEGVSYLIDSSSGAHGVPAGHTNPSW